MLMALEPRGLHVRRADRRHERRRGAGGARPDRTSSSRSASKTILLVEHKMDVVRALADRIIVLHNGTLVADGEPAEVIASPIVQEAYLGMRPAQAAARGRPWLTLRASALPACTPHIGRVPHPARRRPDRAARRRSRCCSGRNGAGKTTTLRTIMGLWQARAGRDHASTARTSPSMRDARHRARSASPTCRRAWASSPTSRCSENLLLARARRAARRTQLDWIFGFFPALKKFWNYPAGNAVRRAEADAGDRARHRRAAQAAADRRADQGPGAGDRRSA